MTADELRSWMAAHNYSVRGLAATLGIGAPTIQRWRDGSRSIPGTLRQRLRLLEAPTMTTTPTMLTQEDIASLILDDGPLAAIEIIEGSGPAMVKAALDRDPPIAQPTGWMVARGNGMALFVPLGDDGQPDRTAAGVLWVNSDDRAPFVRAARDAGGADHLVVAVKVRA